MEDKIIKARLVEDDEVEAPRLLKRDIYQAGIEARRILEAADRQARDLLEDAARRREEVLEAGRQQGYREGLMQWDEARRGLLRAHEAADAKYEGELVRLSVRIAEKIIGEELKTRPETIVCIVRECLRGMRNQQSLTVRVNVSEREEVLKHIESWSGMGGGVHVVADSAVPPGGCIVESERGIVDARLETQLQRLDDILTRIASRP